MSQWFLHDPSANRRLGPMDADAARAEAARNPSLLAWKEGMGDWLPVRNIAELYDAAPGGVAGAPPPPPRPLSQQGRVFDVMVRNAMWRRVELFARDDVPGLAALDAGGDYGEKEWDAALEAYFAEHDRLLTDADARGPVLLSVEKRPGTWEATQTLHDPDGKTP